MCILFHFLSKTAHCAGGWAIVADFLDGRGSSTIFLTQAQMGCRQFFRLNEFDDSDFYRVCMCLCVCVEEKVRKGDKKLWHSNVRDWSYCGVKKLESLKGRKKLFKTNSMSQKCLKYRAFVIARIGLFSWDLTGVCFRLNLFSPDNLCIKHWFKQSWFDTTVISSSLAVLTHFIYLSQTHI